VWAHYSVAHFTQSQLAKLFNCGVDTVANAIKWCAENRTQFKSSVLAESAKEAVEAKLRELGNDLVRIKDKEPVNWNVVIGFEKLILENRQLLWKLQAVMQDKSGVTVNNIIENNQIIKARDELVEGMSDGERQQVLSRIREVLEESNVNQETNAGLRMDIGEYRL
jgi:hypothetical protein